jgi:RimJ/RimL family protein N-acetyltransferase
VRPMTSQDAGYVVELCAMPHARQFVHGPTAEQVVAGLDDADVGSFIVEAAGQRVGMLRLGWIGQPVWLVELRVLVIGEPGKGYGALAVRWAQEATFVDRRAHRLCLEVATHNRRACSLYERLGFVREGVWRDGFRDRDGSYHDLAAYGMLENEDRGTR